MIWFGRAASTAEIHGCQLINSTTPLSNKAWMVMIRPKIIKIRLPGIETFMGNLKNHKKQVAQVQNHHKCHKILKKERNVNKSDKKPSMARGQRLIRLYHRHWWTSLITSHKELASHLNRIKKEARRNLSSHVNLLIHKILISNKKKNNLNLEIKNLLLQISCLVYLKKNHSRI